MVSEPPNKVEWWNEGEAFDFSQKTAYKNGFHGKLLKAPKMVFSKVWQVHFQMNKACPEVKHLSFVSPKLEYPTPFEPSLKILQCQKWGKTPYQNTSLREFDDNSNVGTNFTAEIEIYSLEIRCAIKSMWLNHKQLDKLEDI